MKNWILNKSIHIVQYVIEWLEDVHAALVCRRWKIPTPQREPRMIDERGELSAVGVASIEEARKKFIACNKRSRSGEG